MKADYFRAFDGVYPPQIPRLSERRMLAWQFLAALSFGLSLWYLHWRITSSLNLEALAFSIAVLAAEIVLWAGGLLFFFDIWRERDDIQLPPSRTRVEAHLPGGGNISVDIFITTYNEDEICVRTTVLDALRVRVPAAHIVQIWVLDDGDRPEMRAMAAQLGVGYLRRADNRGFKAGNLRNALLQTNGDFVVICDADTRLLPSFLENTLGYFRRQDVAWVQTPHWFYDVPPGKPWRTNLPGLLARPLEWVTGRSGPGADPFMISSAMFFDVIQRRRNRHGASFCCGAASVHRREPLFAEALKRSLATRVSRADGGLAAATFTPAEPFRFHVSEDLFTSMCLHSTGRWRSVYHPQVEARMLSPWSIEAWAAQKLKYAGGTLDIFLRHSGLLGGSMPWPIKLHYLATFMSYSMAVVQLVLVAAPVITLFTGMAPVAAYSSDFFLHLVPVLLANEAALLAASKRADMHQGRIQQLAGLPLTLYALWQVLRGRKIGFAPTPKTPGRGADLRHVRVHLAVLTIMLGALVWAIVQHMTGADGYSQTLLVVNGVWLIWNAWPFWKAISAALWRPDRALGDAEMGPLNEWRPSDAR
ncbi:MAG: glycosyltransferase [Shimia sp.]